MNQLDMFSNVGATICPTIVQEVQSCPQPPAGISETSIAAAESIKPSAATERAIVLKYIRDRGKNGATRQEIETALNMSSGSICPRVWELMRARPTPLVIETMDKRQTKSGRFAYVIIASS